MANQVLPVLKLQPTGHQPDHSDRLHRHVVDLPLRGSGTRTVDPVLENVVKKADEIDLESPLLGQRRDVRGVRRRKGLRDEVDIRQHKRSPTAEDELLESVLQTAVVQSVREALRKAVDKALASNEASRKTATRQSTRREDGGGDKNGGSYGSTGGNGGKSDEKDDGVIRVLVPKDPKFFSDTTDFLIGALFILGITIVPAAVVSYAANFFNFEFLPFNDAKEFLGRFLP